MVLWSTSHGPSPPPAGNRHRISRPIFSIQHQGRLHIVHSTTNRSRPSTNRGLSHVYSPSITALMPGCAGIKTALHYMESLTVVAWPRSRQGRIRGLRAGRSSDRPLKQDRGAGGRHECPFNRHAPASCAVNRMPLPVITPAYQPLLCQAHT
jgi:hypothetical protein